MTTRARLFLASALMLFLELTLIRWLGANLLHLSYFSNIVLLASFLGIGLGFLAAKRDQGPPAWFPPVLFFVLFAVLAVPGGIDQSGSDLIYFTSVDDSALLPPEITLGIVFVAVAAIMAGPGLLVAQCFFELPRLEAYRWDLLGSLTGTVSFAILSLVGAGPILWGLIVATATMVLIPPRKHPVSLLMLGVVVLLSLGVLRGDVWSPYYRIQEVAVSGTESDGTPYDGIAVLANGVPHQAVLDLDVRLRNEPIYALPYDRIGRPEPLGDVLVIGAGNGSDVALALRKGARSVDAVEIDPRIRDIGVARHPQRPYADPRVTVHIGDGREFLRQTDKTYDLIVFALPDSLTLVAGSNQLRLESYLFTVEALQDVRARLKDGGAFAMYNYFREDWLIGRLAATAEEAFGHAPCVDTFEGRQAVVVVGLTAEDQRCGDPATEPTAQASVEGPPGVHDSRPFLYLKDATIPALFLVVIAIIVVVSLVSVRVVGGPYRRMAPYLDLAALGAAFLLLETRAVTWSALLFGTTWIVNAIVFAGVLLVVLLAVEVTRRLPRRPSRPVSYGLLAVTLVIAWAVPTWWMLELPMAARVVVAVLVAFGPVFASNIIFASRFDTTEDPTGAFAANLLGAMVGGCLEYVALIIGYPGLLGIAALLYAAAFALAPRTTRPVLSPA